MFLPIRRPNASAGVLRVNTRTALFVAHVAEGVNSAATALRRAREYKVDMPITEAVNAVLFDGADPRATLKKILAREARSEVR